MPQKPIINTNHIPDDVFCYQDEQFSDFIRKYIRHINNQIYMSFRKSAMQIFI